MYSSNSSLFLWRCANITSNTSKFLEALGIATLMTVVCFIMPVLWNRCTPLPIDMEDWSDQEKKLVGELVPLYCNSQVEITKHFFFFLKNHILLS